MPHLLKGDLEIKLTEDGSHTLYSHRFDSTYHSINGAILESEHVFIQKGLQFVFDKSKKGQIRILESGLGTGLNALLSFRFAMHHQTDIHYLSLEQYPIGEEIASKLNYPTQLKSPELKDIFLRIHRSKPGEDLTLSPNFKFRWEKTSFESFDYPLDHFDLIFFDPFDAAVHAEVWELAFLRKLYDSLKPNGILITYGAKGSFKRALSSLGMMVEPLPGPPGKREITRGVKQ